MADNGNGTSLATKILFWVMGSVISVGTVAGSALTKAVWDQGQEVAAIRERDRYLMEEMRIIRADVAQIRGDLNQLLVRKP